MGGIFSANKEIDKTETQEYYVAQLKNCKKKEEKLKKKKNDLLIPILQRPTN